VALVGCSGLIQSVFDQCRVGERSTELTPKSHVELRT